MVMEVGMLTDAKRAINQICVLFCRGGGERCVILGKHLSFSIKKWLKLPLVLHKEESVMGETNTLC